MKIVLRITLVAMMLLTAVASWAQASFTVNAPALTALGQPFRVEFSIDAEADSNTFKAPSFEGFDILAGPSVSTGHSVQFINGKQSSSYNCTYTYVLMPTEVGKYNIGQATIKVKGKSYSTKSLLIEVIAEKESASSKEASSQNPEARIGKDDILLRLRISDTELYKGESMRASLVLYTRVSVSNIADINIPPFEGFWSQETSFDNTPSREEYNGRIYETYKLKEYLLSPQKSGKLNIEPTTMEVIVPVTIQENNGFDPIFGGRRTYEVKRTLSTQPTTVNVKEFPANAPASFNGAVGEFTLQSTMPQSIINANSSDQIEITISGSGNLKFITAPAVSLPESFEVYDTKVADNVKLAGDITTGSTTYTYPFVARSAGSFTIPPIAFSYLNPTTGEYHTLTTEAFTIEVKDDGKSTAAANVAGYNNYGSPMRQLDREIRFIHTGSLPLKAAPAFILTPLYWLAIVLLVALFIVAYVALRKRIRENNNAVAHRMKHADKVAVQRLRVAQRYMTEDNKRAFYEEMLRAMWGYISDKFNIPVSNLTKETIREELYRRNVTASVGEQFCEIISRSEEAQYAPSTTESMDVVYADAVEVISKIESAIKK
jgi:hypothetical protein